MRKKAWTYQLKKQVEKFGADKASWYVGWLDPSGKLRCKSCGPGKRGKSDAEKVADKTHSQLVTGTYAQSDRKTWDDFFKDYERRTINVMDAQSAEAARICLNHFKRVVKPCRMSAITTDTIKDYIEKRSKEKRGERTISPATLNKELRYIKAALRDAAESDLLKKVPKFKFLKEPKRLPTFVPPDHFAAIYRACDNATFPNDVPNVTAPDWWRAILVTAYLTGWRIGQILALKWEDVDIDKGTAVSLAEDNKGRRDVRLPLHSAVVSHLRKIAGSFDSHVFRWNLNERQLWIEFQRIQESAKLADDTALPKGGKRGWYGFHDLRRGFATQNAEGMDLFQLQVLMQHKSLETTRRYVNMANSLNSAVDGLYVPEVLRAAVGG